MCLAKVLKKVHIGNGSMWGMGNVESGAEVGGSLMSEFCAILPSEGTLGIQRRPDSVKMWLELSTFTSCTLPLSTVCTLAGRQRSDGSCQ